MQRVAHHDRQLGTGFTPLEQLHHFKAVVPRLREVDGVLGIVEHTRISAGNTFGAMPDGHNVGQFALAVGPDHITQTAISKRQTVVLLHCCLEPGNVFGTGRRRGVALAHLHLPIDQVRTVLRRIGQLERVPAHVAVRGKRGVNAAHSLHEHLCPKAVVEPEHQRLSLVCLGDQQGQQRGFTHAGISRHA